jgi:hypothetical protein
MFSHTMFPQSTLPPTALLPRHGHTADAAKLYVTVTDVVGLQRVLTLLNGRNHAFTRFEAEEAGGGRWTLRLDLVGTPAQLDLVAARLHRVPSVLDVEVRPGATLSVAG